MLIKPISLCVMLASTPQGNTTDETCTAGHEHPFVATTYCPTEPVGWIGRDGGMAGDGWDGEGANATTIYFHIENTSNDLTAREQRLAYITALQTWADIVQIDFVEIGVPNWNRAIDLRYAVGDHCAIESDECGDPDCPFDGPGGTIAHAGFPPGVNSQCVDPMTETWAGNVHFDDDDLFEQDNAGNDGYSLTLIAAHEIGHAIGLTHDTGPGGPHIMRPNFGWNDGMHDPSASDIANLRSGYAAGTGDVATFEEEGIWVNSAYYGHELGIAGYPFNTIAEGITALPPGNDGITLNVLGGLYPETLTISTPCTITAIGQPAYIGQ